MCSSDLAFLNQTWLNWERHRSKGRSLALLVKHRKKSQVQALVSKYTQGRTVGFLGEPRVNVLLLNIALDQQK